MSEYINIGTEDLAYSLDHVSSRVKEATDAVHAMNASVCAAERDAAESVCDSVNRGFFTLIRSQLLQKKVQVQSVAESQLLTLRHFAQSLLRIKQQMGVDFERITGRYMKLFKSLGESLQNRVYALDRPVAEVADIDYAAMDRRVLMAGVPAVIVQQDAVSVANQLMAVRCKRDCQKVMVGVKDLINHGARLARTMEGIMRDVHQDGVRTIYLPVLVSETSDLFLLDGTQTDFVMPEEGCPESTVTRVRRMCFESVGRLSWASASAEHRNEVVRRVRRLVSEQGGSREGKLVSDLLEKSEWKELEAVG